MTPSPTSPNLAYNNALGNQNFCLQQALNKNCSPVGDNQVRIILVCALKLFKQFKLLCEEFSDEHFYEVYFTLTSFQYY